MAGARGDKQNGKGKTIIIRREEVVEGGHHGGAWKVAYADFVTAMMAFFLLMWLLNATTQEQRKGLADYFSPNNLLSRASSGTGKPFGGSTANVVGALASDRGEVRIIHGRAPVVDAEEDDVPEAAQPTAAAAARKDGDPNGAAAGMAQATDGTGTEAHPPGTSRSATIRAVLTPLQDERQMAENPVAGRRAPTPEEMRAELARAEKLQFAEAADQIRDAVRSDPALARLSSQLAIDLTPEGLRIQILDEEHSPMFATGSSVPNERARQLLQKVAPILARLPEEISLSGHTDAAPYRGPDRSNWELSTERANATRRLLLEAGLPEQRIRNVTGNADRDPLLPADPMAAANRRIAIVVLRGSAAPTR